MSLGHRDRQVVGLKRKNPSVRSCLTDAQTLALETRHQLCVLHLQLSDCRQVPEAPSLGLSFLIYRIKIRNASLTQLCR